MSGSAARLDHIQLLSEAPERLAGFYQDAMAMRADRVDGDLWLCAAPGRRLLIARGRSGTLGFGAYRLESADGLAAMRARLERNGVMLGPSRSPLFAHDAFSLADPDGNTMVFGLGTSASEGAAAGTALRGRLQHLVVASADVERMVQFYSEVIGLPVSDKALQNGAITACWLRTNHEHHTLAVFRAPGGRLDHYSYEVDDWSLIRDWADHFAAQGIKLIWGPGRHGPGNNLFIMVHDPDANRVELSAELEIVDGVRPVGIWPHEESTFNKWGPASLRT